MNTQNNQENIFDESLLKCRQKRAKAQGFVSFLHDKVILDLKDRLNEQRQGFPAVSIIGPFAKYWGRNLPIEHFNCHEDAQILPIKSNSSDLIISALYLHSVNDPIARLVQMRRGLKEGGILFAYAFGENSLYELRKSFEYADCENSGEGLPRVNPTADVPTFGSLLRRGGFNYCVSDKISYVIEYDDPKELFFDIRGMGETNAMRERSRRPLHKKVLRDALNFYKKNFASLNSKDKYQATFDIVCLTGWNSKPNQLLG